MRIFCLGGAGRICREAALDVARHTDAEEIVVSDADEEAGREVAAWIADPRVRFVRLDVADRARTVAALRGFDVVMDGLTIALNGPASAAIAEAGCHGVNLNGFGEERRHDAAFRAAGRIMVAGFGMTPGTTNLMAMHAARQLDRVEAVRVSHGAYRPIAFSASIAETTRYEYDPGLPNRCAFEDGEFKQVPPFSRPRAIRLPPPYGELPQYIIPHSETFCLAESLKAKGVRLIETRGTWPAKNMQLVRALYDWGIMRNDRVALQGAEFGVFDAVAAYLQQSREGTTTELYGYALHVEVDGWKDGRIRRHTLTHTHPPSDGSVPDWAGLRAYTRNVGIPMGVAAAFIGRGLHRGAGVVNPELAFEPAAFFAALAERDIRIREEIAEHETMPP
jgi:saccharopine dehydrogenase-like NADP-dependent oxidoreductase